MNQKMALWCDTQNPPTEISIMVLHIKPTNKNNGNNIPKLNYGGPFRQFYSDISK